MKKKREKGAKKCRNVLIECIEIFTYFYEKTLEKVESGEKLLNVYKFLNISVQKIEENLKESGEMLLIKRI